MASGQTRDKMGVEHDPTGDQRDDETAKHRVRLLRNRKKSSKGRLTKARNHLRELLEERSDGTFTNKSAVRSAMSKVTAEFDILKKVMTNLKEAIALGDDGEMDADAVLEALENDLSEITFQVFQSLELANKHLRARLEKGEIESIVPPPIEDDKESQAPSVSTLSSLAERRKREADEATERLRLLEQQQKEQQRDLERQIAQLELAKQRTEEARKLVALSEARARTTAQEEMELAIRDTERDHKRKQQIDPYTEQRFRNAQKVAPVKLKGVELPTFTGEDKADYEPWKAAFMSVVDESYISAQEKMLRLQGSLKGKALKMVKDIGYSLNAYERAKEKLEKKFGGERRTQLKQLAALRNWRKLRPRNLDDLEDFLAVLDRVLIVLRDCESGELTGQSLNLTAKEKIPEEDLQAYKLWLFEQKERDTFETLVQWVEMKVEIMDEAREEAGEFYKRNNARSDYKKDDRRHVKGFSTSRKARKCIVEHCKEDHPPWTCRIFKEMTVPARKELIARSRHCFRCLATDHFSK